MLLRRKRTRLPHDPGVLWHRTRLCSDRYVCKQSSAPKLFGVGSARSTSNWFVSRGLYNGDWWFCHPAGSLPPCVIQNPPFELVPTQSFNRHRAYRIPWGRAPSITVKSRALRPPRPGLSIFFLSKEWSAPGRSSKVLSKNARTKDVDFAFFHQNTLTVISLGLISVLRIFKSSEDTALHEAWRTVFYLFCCLPSRKNICVGFMLNRLIRSIDIASHCF